MGRGDGHLGLAIQVGQQAHASGELPRRGLAGGLAGGRGALALAQGRQVSGDVI